ncbi:MAG: hypothetical protein LUF35_05715 [Lachnospiraceae bacterium]|nr:hypothetical protein [Lachnospiraceae bacterium]
MPSTIDWNATAAWIALAISIVGTIASPLITSLLNNRHQLKMYKMKAVEKRLGSINSARTAALESYLANTGKYISTQYPPHQAKFSSTYFAVYQYVPERLWDSLDDLYNLIEQEHWSDARAKFQNINREITALLKEPLQ